MVEKASSVEDTWNFKGMVTAKKGATICIRGELRELQRICEVGSEAVATTIFDVIELAREGMEMKRKNPTMSSLKID